MIRVIRDRAEWRVIEIMLGDQHAFLKQLLTDDAAAKVQVMAARLHAAGRALDQQTHAVAMPLLVLAERGVLITHAASGRPLADLLATADAEQRATLIARVGAWLRALGATSRSRGEFGPHFWIRGLAARRAACTGGWIDQVLVSGHMRVLRHLAPALRGVPVERGHLHGDLTPDNLFYDAARERMTGIDLQGCGEMAVARDMARFLVWLESRRITPEPVQIDGIAAADHHALTAVPDLLAPDQQPILRFMIGEILLSYYLDSARQPVRRAALARAMCGWAQAADAT